MLSKIALLVAGLIAEKPLNPYEIQKFIEITDFNRMYFMSTSSIYATINGLAKRGYITGKKVKNGKMPDKTIYSITKKGKESIKKSLIKYLSESEDIFSEFDITMAFICHLGKEDALEALSSHSAKLKNIIADSKANYKAVRQSGAIPYTGLTRRKHHIYKRQAELKTISELMVHIQKDEEWNHFPALEWLL